MKSDGAAGGRLPHMVFVHQTFSRDNAEGSGRANAFAEAAVAAGYRVTIVASAVSYLSGQLADQYRGRLFVEEQADGYTVVRPWTYTQLHRSFAHRLLYFVSYMVTSFVALLRLPKCDAIVGCSPPITVAIVAWAASALRRTTFVFEVRDLWPAFPIQMGVIRNRAVVAISRWIERLLYRKASRIIINSPGFLPYLHEAGVDESKIHLIPNGVDVAVFRPREPDVDLRTSLGLRDKFVVLYVGAHGPANSLGTLIEAAELLKGDARCHVVTIGDGKEKRNLQKKADDAGLKNVTFLPPQPKQDIPKYIAMADVCYVSLQRIPMFTTTYPNKIFDYMACGKPTITTVDGVSRTVIENAQAGIFVPHDARAIAERIRWAMENRSALEEMGRRGRRSAEQMWDRRAFANQFIALMDQVTGA